MLLRGLAGAPVRRGGVAAAAQRSGAVERGEGGGARVRGGGCGWEEEGRLGLLFVGCRDGLGVRARDWKAGETPGEDRVRRLCDAGKEELTRGVRVSAGQRLSGRRGAGLLGSWRRASAG